MAILYKLMKRRVNGTFRKQVTPIESLSVGTDFSRNTVAIWFLDHVAHVSKQDVSFLIEQLAIAQKRLDDQGGE